ncbi:MAG: hypothetical protein ABR564_08255 [Candidatus Dormibacteria bacterium]
MTRSQAGRQRLWTWATLFMLTLAAANTLIAGLEPRLQPMSSQDTPGSVNRARNLLGSGPRPDVLFMGSSLTNFGLDPRVAERAMARAGLSLKSAMNVGVLAGNIDINYLLLKNVIREEAKPRVIVYGISDYELNSLVVDDEARLRLMSPLLRLDDYDQYSGHGLRDKAHFLLDRLLPVYRDHQLVHDVIDPPPNPPRNVEPTYRGFYGIPPRSRFATWTDATAFEGILRPYVFTGRQLNRMREFLSLAHARQIDVVLVNMPATSLHRSYWSSPADVDRYVQMVGSLAAGAHVPLLEMYRDAENRIPPEDYSDSHHLNEAGAAVLTELVTTRYLIPALIRR